MRNWSDLVVFARAELGEERLEQRLRRLHGHDPRIGAVPGHQRPVREGCDGYCVGRFTVPADQQPRDASHAKQDEGGDRPSGPNPHHVILPGMGGRVGCDVGNCRGECRRSAFSTLHGCYFFTDLPTSSMNSPTLRRPRPIASCVSPAASFAIPSFLSCSSSVKSPVACLILPFSASAFPSISSRFIMTLLGKCRRASRGATRPAGVSKWSDLPAGGSCSAG